MTPLEAAWERVHREAARLRPTHLRTLFADDPARFRAALLRLSKT